MGEQDRTWLSRDLALLFTGRALRSISQGYLAIIVPLYLARLGLPATRVGIFFTAGAVGSMALTALVGIGADRFGRKTLLVLLGLLTGASGLAFALTRRFAVLLVAAALGTIGRGGGAGSGGAYGPYFPAEQALIAEHAGSRWRTHAFGVVSLIGVLSGAVGAVVATIPGLLARGGAVSILVSDRVLFLLTAAIGVAMAVVVLPVREGPRPPRVRGAPRLAPGTGKILLRFFITNSTNGLAVGMLGPVLVYWFHIRYGVTSAQLGPLYLIANLAAAPANLLSARIARALGPVRAIVTARGVSVCLLSLVPLMPTFPLAGLVFLLRTQANSLSNPIRQSFLMGVVAERDRSTAAGLSNLPLQAFSSAGPTIAGWLMEVVWVGLPLELAAGLQGVNAVLYWLLFRNVPMRDEEE